MSIKSSAERAYGGGGINEDDPQISDKTKVWCFQKNSILHSIRLEFMLFAVVSSP